MIMSGVAAQMAIADPPIDEKQTAKGEAIYRAKCASCYGEKGEGGTKQYAEPLVGDASLCPRWEAWGRKHGEAWGKHGDTHKLQFSNLIPRVGQK